MAVLTLPDAALAPDLNAFAAFWKLAALNFFAELAHVGLGLLDLRAGGCRRPGARCTGESEQHGRREPCGHHDPERAHPQPPSDEGLPGDPRTLPQ